MKVMKEIYQIAIESHDSNGKNNHFTSSLAYATYELALNALFDWYKEDVKLYSDCIVKKDKDKRIIEYFYIFNGTTFFVTIHSLSLIGFSND